MNFSQPAATLVNRVMRPFGVRIARAEAHPISKSAIGPRTAQEDWRAERAYWHEVVQEFYQSKFGLSLDPIQSDPSIVPPKSLVDLIQSPQMAHPNGFYGSGYRNILAYLEELDDHGFHVNQMESILEFGVGLGRLLIHFFPFQAELHGCEVTESVFDWTQQNLGHRARLKLTQLEPPLPYDDNSFDFVYANSVFTHTPQGCILDWVKEIHRIIKPGGCFITTVFDSTERFSRYSYREFHRSWDQQGIRETGSQRGVLRTTYLSRKSLFDLWGQFFTVLELRTQYRDQSHLIVRKD